MPRRSPDDREIREELLHLLPLSGSLAGLCIGAITLFRFNSAAGRLATVADDLLAVCALLFLICTYLVFWALRSTGGRRQRVLLRVVDGSFLTALTLLVGVGFLLVYAIV
jgi:hypothetical protein